MFLITKSMYYFFGCKSLYIINNDDTDKIKRFIIGTSH